MLLMSIRRDSVWSPRSARSRVITHPPPVDSPAPPCSDAAAVRLPRRPYQWWSRSSTERIPRRNRACFATTSTWSCWTACWSFASHRGERHATVVVKVRRALERALGDAYHVRDQSPVALDRMSDPEPYLPEVHD